MARLMYRRRAKRSASAPRYSPARRLYQLKLLLDTSGGLSVYDIAERLDVTVRTAIRLLKALEAAGEPLTDELVGKTKVHRLMESAQHAKLELTVQQMVTLYLSRRVFDFLAGTGLREDLDDVFVKLKTTLKRKDLVLARNLDKKVFDVNEAPHIYQGRIDHVNHIITALLKEERLSVAHGKSRRSFLLDPYTLLVYKKGLYLAGLSHRRKAVRIFALDGLRNVEWQRGDKFEYPANFDPEKLTEGAFGLIGGERTKVRIFFDDKVAGFVRRRLWHPTQRIKAVPGGIELTMEVAGTVEVLNWVLSYGDKAEVLEPASLRDGVAGELRRAATRYGR